MKRFSHFKIGDTLVEVALAIGIFSMVAIAVVSVVSGSSSSTQAALETTITREEIDSQAEALRFIHAAYNAGGELGGSETDKYKTIWGEIIKNAVDPTKDSQEIVDAVTKYNPSTCAVLYKESTSDADYIGNQHAFIVNPKNLSLEKVDSSNVGNIVIRADGSNKDKFKAASTYPRLVYETRTGLDDDSNATLSLNASNNLEYAEGIYIVAVKDPNSTVIISDDGNGGQKQNMSAYYDFYIHTCWFNPNEEQPSTISTVVRLYDPDVNDFSVGSNNFATYFIGNGGTPNRTRKTAEIGEAVTIPSETPTREHYRFIGWNTVASPTASSPGIWYNPGDTIPANSNGALMLYAQWEIIEWTIGLNANGGSFPSSGSERITGKELLCADTEDTCWIPNSNDYIPTRSGYEFLGWARNSSATAKTQDPGDTISNPRNNSTTFYAVWKEQNETLYVELAFPSGDCDSHVTGEKSDGTEFHAYYNNKVGSDINGLVLASLNHDYTSGGTETFTINTLGGRDYYYYVHNFKNCNFNKATVTIKDSDLNIRQTFNYDPNHYANNTWQVFAYKDGRITTGW